MNKATIKHLVRLALREDLPKGDITTNSLVHVQSRSKARIFTKDPATVCGLEIAALVFKTLAPDIRLLSTIKDAQKVPINTTVLTIEGSTRAILTGERTALNFLSYLSAIATKTREFVDKVRPYKVKILDTRKTTPTLRYLERYAVRCGGGFNHRDNLSDAVMIKDNHWVCSHQGSLTDAIAGIKQKYKVPLIVEVDDLIQLAGILQSKADIVLLDNMKPATVRKAVAMRRKFKSGVLFEVSGGVTVNNVRDYASTGVERISIGELTHSRRSVDFSLEITR